MKITHILLAAVSAAGVAACAQTQTPPPEAADAGEEVCGPQAPRDISVAGGTNTVPVPPGETPNLCNVHFHMPFEHAGFDAFEIPADSGADPVCGSVKVGDKVEFHWVHTNCDLPETPKPGLNNCVCDRDDLTLRVITQAYVVGDTGAELAMPSGEMVKFAGSTTGPSYSDEVCSPARVNWEVKKNVETLSRESLAGFCADNAWSESEPHGIREVVQREDWLSPFQP